ncbi:Serine/threonine protein kinase [Giardia duodenalis]|uniref:Serine/threonine protein kinase n=1 Tax=Giardia intestinalis TaxID=5741 RepID=V6TQ41_GIAIN|nr:Serine/threonine protein kinase [Giardia intestinalis]
MSQYVLHCGLDLQKIEQLKSTLCQECRTAAT